MTTTTPVRVRPSRRVPESAALEARIAVPLAVIAVALLRLPFLTRPLSPDEAGFLTVAAQWHAGGTSLYGDYWVDRPPLLLMFFQLAGALGGTIALRVLGIAAAAVAVVAVARTAELLAGRRGAVVAAVATAAWLVSPLVGSQEVDGELLAAPFVAVGIAGVAQALSTSSRSHAIRASFVAGLAGAAAVLVKQNMLDVLVFAGVALFVARGPRTRRSGPRTAVLACGFVGGAALAVLLVGAWTVVHGTSLGGVWYAMYPFREAAHAVMSAHPSSAVHGRTLALVGGAIGSGLLAAMVLLSVVLPRISGDRSARIRGALAIALAAVLTYDLVSIYLGGSYWMHYLVQLAVPAGLGAGLATTVRPRVGAGIAGAAALSAAVAVGVVAIRPASDDGPPIGSAIANVARPEDSIVTVWGHADVTQASGLPSPYPYLWSIPERTLDPRLTQLTADLRGSDAPTWFVSLSGPHPVLSGVDTRALDHVLAHRYRHVADLDGAAIYLRDGVRRAAPELPPPTFAPTHQEAS